MRQLKDLKAFKERIYHIYFLHGFSSFGISLFSILVPVYLLTLGYSFQQVIKFFIIQFTTVIAFVFVAGYLAKWVGLKKIILIRLPLLFAYIYLLYALGNFAIPIWILAVLEGIEIAFYWIPMQALFARLTEVGSMGRQVGALGFYAALAGAFAPLLGGFITSAFGFQMLFGVGMIVVLLSHIPLFWTPDVQPVTDFKFKRGLRFFRNNKAYLWGTFVRSFDHNTTLFIWPMFVFFVLKSPLSVGVVGTLMGVFGAVFLKLVGKLTDHFNKKKVMAVGIVLVSMSWILRSFFHANAYHIFILSALAGLFYIIMEIPYRALGYEIAKREDVDEFTVFREVPVFLARMVVFGLALLLTANMPLFFFIIGAFYLFFLVY